MLIGKKCVKITYSMTVKIKPITDNYYHIYNRGTEKRIIFNDNSDYVRFLHLLYVCNDTELKVKNTGRVLNNQQNKHEQGSALLVNGMMGKSPIVNIVCYCLMPNHFHLVLEQLVDNGISAFMHKLSTAYVMAFNKKHERTGRLFEGSFKTRFIKDDTYLLYLSKYIHLNPVSIIDPRWKERGVNDWEKINKYLESYRWSSYMDYVDIKNFPSIINKGFLRQYYFNGKQYKDFINSYLTDDLQKIS